MMPHEMFDAIIRGLARHGIAGYAAHVMAHTIMDEIEEA